MIAERVVLLRVENLEQCRRRIAPEVGPELVNFVEDEDWIARTCPAQALNDLARQRPDVRAAMAANFGLISHAAE